MSWKVKLGVGILALLGALMVIGFVKSLVLSLVPLAILLLAGYGVFRLYVGSRGKAKATGTEAPQLPATRHPRSRPVPRRMRRPDCAKSARKRPLSSGSRRLVRLTRRIVLASRLIHYQEGGSSRAARRIRVA
ncbi:hypothetical protein AB0J47_27775 [Nocardia sp. NPDC049737]|uniref:hypothetical protein n=1 Tax=Nocardia sp. NPDC049737 TaxID=3154358 RepID=UPI003430881B